MKKLLLMIMIHILPIPLFAQCNDISNEFISKWQVEKDRLIVNIKRKDDKNFIYYNIRGRSGEAFVGYKFVNGQKLLSTDIFGKTNNDVNLLVSYRGNNKQEAKVIMQNLGDLLVDNNTLITTGLSNENIEMSTIYDFPLGETYIKDVKIFNKDFNVTKNINYFRQELNNNRIFGTQKIKFYVHLIHDSKVMTCSKFESPEIEYNFGMKPIKLIWKDFIK